MKRSFFPIREQTASISAGNEDFYGILLALLAVPEFEPYIRNISRQAIERVRHTKKWINDKALEDSGHSALRPTTLSPDLSQLTHDEAEIYSLICRRFVAMFLPPLVQNKRRLVADIDGKTFVSNGKTVIDPGYSVIFGTKFTDNVIPEHEIGDNIEVDAFEVTEKTSQCPKRYTSPDLIAVCENPAKFLEDKKLKVLGKRLKIGTPATRSGIIEQLIVKDRYLELKREGKKDYIHPTDIGMAIIRNLGPCDICKVDLTGEWEEKLEDVRTGKLSLQKLEEEMRQGVRDMIADIKRTPMTPFSMRSSTKVVGTCSSCGKDIIESEKGFSCTGYKKDGTGCNIMLWKNKWGTTFSYDDFVALIDEKKVIEKNITVSLKSWKQKDQI
jgi:Topoisomerase IA